MADKAQRSAFSLPYLAFAIAFVFFLSGLHAAPVFTPQNMTIKIPPMVLNVNVSVPGTNPQTGQQTLYANNMTIPVNGIEFNITLPASVSYAIYNSLNATLNYSVLRSAFYSSLSSALPAAANASSSNQTAKNLTSAYVGPLSSSLASSLSYTLPLSIASVLPTAISTSLSASLSSALYTSIPAALSQSLSESLTKVIPIVSAGTVNYSSGSTYGFYGTTQATPSEIASYIAASMQSNLTSTMQPILESRLSSAIYAGLQRSLQTSIPSALGTAGLSRNVSALINESLRNQLNGSLAQAASASLTHNAVIGLSANLSSGIASTLSQSLSSDLSTQLTSQLGQSLSQQVSQNLGAGIAAYTSQQVSSSMKASLQTSLPSYLGSGYSGGFATDPYQFGASFSTPPPAGIPYMQSGNGTYIVTSTTPQYMSSGQLGYILLNQMSPSLGSASPYLGMAVGAATQGLTPYSALAAVQTALPIALPGAIASSVSYTLGAELGSGLSSQSLVTLGTTLAASSGSAGAQQAAYLGGSALNLVQSGIPGMSAGYLINMAGMYSGNQELQAAGALLQGYQVSGLPGIVAGLGGATGSPYLSAAATLLGEYQSNVDVGTFAESLGGMLGYGNYAAGAAYGLAALQSGGNIGNLAAAMGTLSGSTSMIQAGYALSLLQSGTTVSPLLLAEQLAGPSGMSNVGATLSGLSGGATLGTGLTAAGALTGSSGLAGAGYLLNMFGNGGTVGSLIGQVGAYYGGGLMGGGLGAIEGSPYAAGLLANGGYGTALESLSALQNGLLTGPTTVGSEISLGNLPVGITASTGLNGGTQAALGLGTGYGTLLGGVLPVSVLGNINFILPESNPSLSGIGIPGLSGLFPGIPGIGGFGGLSDLLNTQIPDLNPFINGIPGLSSLNIPGLGDLGNFGGIGPLPGIQSLLGPLPDISGLLPNLSGLGIPGIPGLDLSGFNIPGLNLLNGQGLPGLGSILSGYNVNSVFGSGGIISGSLGGSVGLSGASLSTNLNIDIGKALSEAGLSQDMVSEIGSAVGYVNTALQAYSILSNLGSSVVTVTAPIVITTPFNSNQTTGSSLVIQNSSSPANALASGTSAVEPKPPFQETGVTGRAANFSSLAFQPLANANGVSPSPITTNFNIIPQKQVITIGPPYQTSPANQVASYNANNAAWFLTCPTAPQNNPTDNRFFDANYNMSVAGDACIATGGSLTTIVTLSTTVHTFSPCIPVPDPAAITGDFYKILEDLCAYSVVQPLKVQNPGILSVQLLTYSPEVDGLLSNGWNTNSYVFQQVPSMAQAAVWSWNAEYANFSKAHGSNQDSVSGLILTVGECTWSYTYSETTTLNSMNNNYIPFTELTTSNGQPAASLENAALPGAASSSVPSGSVGPGTTIGPASSVGGITGCAAQGGAVVNGTCISTGGATTSPASTGKPSLRNLTFERAGTVFAGSLPGATLSQSIVQSDVIPILHFNYNVSLNPHVDGSTQGLAQISEDIYSPWNYFTPYNSIDEFPIDLPGALLFGQGGVLNTIPEKGFGIDTAAQPVPTVYFKNSLQGAAGNATQVNLPTNSLSPATGSAAQATPSGSCPSSNSGVLSKADALACAQAAGFSNTGNTPSTLGLDTVVAISEAESSLNPQAVHDNGVKCSGGANAGQESIDVGVMQINNCAHPDMASCTGTTFGSCSGSATNPAQAYQDAYTLSSSGTDFNPWCTYGPSACGGAGNSAYCQYMPVGDPCATAGSAGGGLVATGGGSGASSYETQMTAYQLENPISIASPGNGYIYVLFKNPNDNNDYEIAVVREFPKGYYNATNVPIPPVGTSNAKCTSESACQSAWGSTWSNYWNNVMQTQSYQSYIVRIIPLSSTYSSGLSSGTQGELGTGALIQQPLPPAENKSGQLNFQASSVVQCSPELPGSPTPTSPAGDINGGQCYPSPPPYSEACLANGNPDTSGQCQLAQDRQCVCSTANGCSGSANGYGYTYYCVPSTGATASSVAIAINENTIQYPGTTTVHASCTPLADTCYIDSPLGTHLASGTGQVSYTTPAAQPAGTYTYYVSDPTTGKTGSVALTVTQGPAGQCASPSGTPNQAVTFNCQFTPYNITADSDGDIFITGVLSGVANQPEIVKIANVIIGGAVCSPSGDFQCDKFSSSSITLPGVSSGSTPQFTEIAAAPVLGNVYLASPNYGGILVLNGGSLAYQNTIQMAFSQNSVTSQASLNVAYWLQQGGLFGHKFSNIAGTSSYSTSASNDFDQAANHHPLALADVNGYLYVLDNWRGTLTSGNNFNILMLRAINSTGADAPVDPALFNDVFAQNTCSNANLDTNRCYTGGADVPPNGACSTGCVPMPNTDSACGNSTFVPNGVDAGTVIPQGYNYECVSSAYGLSTKYYSLSSSTVQTGAYPPYGWIISATVGATSFCGVPGCTYTGSLSQGPYYPVGPKMGSTPCIGTPESQGTVATVINWISAIFTGCGGGISMSVNQNGTVAILMPGSNNAFSGQSELLLSRFNIENYTRIQQGTPPFTCYSTVSGGLCSQYGGLANIAPPVYLSGDPFKYAESQGSIKSLSYANQYYTQFTGGAGTPQGVGGLSSQCISQFYNLTTPSACTGSSAYGVGSALSGGAYSSLGSGLQQGAVPSLAQGNVQPTPTVSSISSQISGEALIGYKYTYTLDQKFSGFSLEPTSCSGTGPGYAYCIAICEAAGKILGFLPSDSKTRTVYSYATTPEAYSNYLTANIEGGDTYLQYGVGQSYYMQNLSDYGLYLSQHVLLNVSTDRLFGSAYAATEGQGTSYSVLGAMQQLQYVVETFTRAQQSYESIVSAPVNGGQYPNTGPQYANTKVPAAGVPANFLFNPTLAAPPTSGAVTLFNWYKQEIYSDPLGLYMPSVVGYQRLMFVLNDRFGNSIFVPIDADIAHATSISLNVSNNLSPSNPNQTALSVYGTIGENAYSGFDVTNKTFVPLSGARVYLYYGKDLNYVDAQGNPLSAEQAQLCAFGYAGSPYLPSSMQFPSQCTLADPMWQGLQSGSDTVTYAPQSQTSSSCAPPPNSLFYTTTAECNIYSAFSLPAVCPAVGARTQYCVPTAYNGNGMCTSQIGLMGTATSAANGSFMFNTFACGIGQASIGASYYGDSVQPISVTQEPLTQSANTLIGSDPSTVAFPVVNFFWQPNTASKIIQIGLFELSFGDIGIASIAIAAAAALLIIIYRRGRNIGSAGGKGRRSAGRKRLL